ncbi:MAG: porin family protein [Mesorhizobium amorphae]|nr:MAG: porin family protein [Mesorhizobium amorphae]
MPLKSSLAFLLAASVALPATVAFAADYEPPVFVDEAPEYTPVEVGSGWYLRGDVGYQLNDHPFGEIDLKDYGIGSIDLADWGLEPSERRFIGSAGIGFHFTDYLRADVNAGYLGRNEFDKGISVGTEDLSGSFKNEAWYGMANAYLDLGTVAGFTPYVGAGAGILSNAWRWDARYESDGEEVFSLSDSGRDYAFAYTLNAGLAYRFADNVSLDVGYQYLSSPGAEYFDLSDLQDHIIGKGLEFHQIRAGLRYDLW